MAENASFKGYLAEVSFDNLEGNQLSYFQNDYFFKILLCFHKNIFRQNAGKK